MKQRISTILLANQRLIHLLFKKLNPTTTLGVKTCLSISITALCLIALGVSLTIFTLYGSPTAPSIQHASTSGSSGNSASTKRTATQKNMPNNKPGTTAKTQKPAYSAPTAKAAAPASPFLSPSTSFFASIDTMKDSRDTNYPTGNQMSATSIQQEVHLISTQHANYATDDAFYDYQSYLAQWANEIHAAGLHVWFRPHFNCWELDNGCSTQMTPSEYLSALTGFLNTNYGIFKPGDIFDPCAEPEDSTYWEHTYGTNWSWQNAPNTGTDAFNNFMLDASNVAQSTLRQHGISDVITGIRSTNGWWPQNPHSLYPSTIKALGYVTYDSYPEGSTTDPATAANARTSELNAITVDNPGIPIVLGEFGYSNDADVSDATQKAVLATEISSISGYNQIVGMNYWVGAGGAGYGGYTNLFAGSRGNWSARPSASVIANYFMQK
ncbi:MAG: hypothetical protein ACHQT5_00750 [Candidatus Saccharimonadales bacterium]